MLYRFIQAAEHKLQVAGKEISGGETVELDPATAGQFAPGVLEPVEAGQKEDVKADPEPEVVAPADKDVAPGPDVDETQPPASRAKS